MNFSVLKCINILIHLQNSKENGLSLLYKFSTADSTSSLNKVSIMVMVIHWAEYILCHGMHANGMHFSK